MRCNTQTAMSVLTLILSNQSGCKKKPQLLFAYCLLILVEVSTHGHALASSRMACVPRACLPPDCYCPGTIGPAQIKREDIPQMIMLTFDDSVQEELNDVYEDVFAARRKNPNGCPISATFYVSHNWTNYDIVKRLYERGHEIASHSITHRMPQSFWTKASYDQWKQELVGQRENIASKASIPVEEIRGVRAPFLETGGDEQFRVLRDEGFEYDATFMSGPHADGGAWPFTLDFPPGVDYCSNNNCPKSRFPGIWELPLNRWISQTESRACSMVDSCETQPANRAEALSYFWHNFNRFYHGTRAPFGVHLHPDWLQKNDGEYMGAFGSFLDSLLDMSDVYFVTAHQVIEWMRDPQPLSEVIHFEPWLTSCPTKSASPKTQASSDRVRSVLNQQTSKSSNDSLAAIRTGLYRQLNANIYNSYHSDTTNDNDLDGAQLRRSSHEKSRRRYSERTSSSDGEASAVAHKGYPSKDDGGRVAKERHFQSPVDHGQNNEDDMNTDARKKKQKASPNVSDFLAHTYDDGDINESNDGLLDRKPKSHRGVPSSSYNRKRVEKERSIPDDHIFSLVEPFGELDRLEDDRLRMNNIENMKITDSVNKHGKRKMPQLTNNAIASLIPGENLSRASSLALVSAKSSSGKELNERLNNLPVAAVPYKFTLATEPLSEKNPNPVNNATSSFVKNGSLNLEMQQVHVGNMTSLAVKFERISLCNVIMTAALSSFTLLH